MLLFKVLIFVLLQSFVSLIILHVLEKQVKPLLVSLFNQFIYSIGIIINEFTKNNWSLQPFIITLLADLRIAATQPRSNHFYSILLALLIFIQDDKQLKLEDSEFLLSIITSVLFDESIFYLSFYSFYQILLLFYMIVLSYVIFFSIVIPFIQIQI